MTGATVRITILGSGASGGVPRADGDWGVCDPAEPRNRRTRCGLLLQRWSGPDRSPEAATTVLFDTPPELRQQLAQAGCRHLDAVIFTHDHADQTHGIDDIRPFALRTRRQIDVRMDAPTAAALTDKFAYVFRGGAGYPAIARLGPEIAPFEPLAVTGPGGALAMTPLAQDHGGRPSLGFRFGAAAYSNDVVAMPERTFAALEGLSVWIVDALRYKPHPTHAHVDLALSWIARLRPKRAILTNLHVDIDYATLSSALPEDVELAFDGLSLDLSANTNFP